MIKRNAFAGALALVGTMLATKTAAADVALPVPQVAQMQTNWCWNASALAVLQYHQQMNISQCQIADWMEVTNGWQDSAAGKAANDPNYCCSFPGNCNFTEPSPGVSGLLGNFDIPGLWFPGTQNNPPVTFSQLTAELDRGNPLIYSLGYNSGGGHVEVISGYSQPGGVPTLELMDPSGGAFALQSYTDMTGGAGYPYWWNTVRYTQSVNQNASTSVITYREGGTQAMYQFAKGTTDFWVDYTFSNPGGSWVWADESHPSGVTMLAGQAVTFLDGSDTQILSAFAMGSDGNLWHRKWNGAGWSWSSLGHPSGVTLGGNISAVAYEEASSPGGNLYTSPRVHVFANSASQLYRATFDGSTWSWHNQGATTLCSSPSVVTYRQNDANLQRNYAFYLGCDNHLWVNYTVDQVTWYNADLGAVPATPVGLPSAIAFHEGFGVGIYAFVLGSNGHLYVMYWNDAVGGGWHWADQGTPSGVTLTKGTYDSHAVSATTYREGGSQRHRIFVHGTNGHLYDNYWNGSTWLWEDRGAPASSVVGQIQTSSYLEPGATSLTSRIRTFVRGADLHVYSNGWDGTQWTWTDQAAPADARN